MPCNFCAAHSNSAQSGASVLLQVVFYPYPIWGPLSSDNPIAKKLKLPTANPPPEYVSAALAYAVLNRGNEEIPKGWNFTLINENYTNIEKVRS